MRWDHFSGNHRKETKPDKCAHQYVETREVGRTGDWFHPRVVEFTCRKCGDTIIEDV